MRFLLIIFVIFFQNNLFGQNRHFITIAGHICDSDTKDCIDSCLVSLISSDGTWREELTDSCGFYSFDSVATNNVIHKLQFERRHFFSVRTKQTKLGMLADTMIDIKLQLIPTSVDEFYEVHFAYNSCVPVDSFKNAISWVIFVLSWEPTSIIKIVGFKDSSESKDLRYKRAKFVYKKLVRRGADKKRLIIEISTRPNIISQYNPTTGNVDFIELNEKYIGNLSVDKRQILRRRNQCVDFIEIKNGL